jgi:hypothetical protein
MQSFAKQGERPGSAQSTGRPTKSSHREIVAKKARVSTKSVGQQQQQHLQEQVHGRRQNGDDGHALVAAQQPQFHQRGQHTGPKVKREAFDTDAESLDTTMPSVSVAHAGEQDQGYDQHEIDEHKSLYGQGDDEGDDEYEEGGDYDQHGHGRFSPTHEMELVEGLDLQDLPPEFQNRVLNKLSPVWDEGNSYPTTTSGVPDDLQQDPLQDSRPTSDFEDNQVESSSPPHRNAVTNQSTLYVPSQPLQRPPAALEVVRPFQSKMYQQSAALRTQTRLEPNHNAPLQSSATVPQSSQPPTYSQATIQLQPTHVTNRNVQHNTGHLNGLALPQRGAQTHPGLGHAQQTRSIAPAGPARPSETAHTIRRHGMTPLVGGVVSTVEERSVDPVEDYDVPALLKMDYNQLKNEDFDTVPRADRPVLTDDTVDKTSGENLEHVQNNLNTTDQANFFSSLTKSEWENVGDWFSERFAAILERSKQARQQKRKIAQDFESEVEKRHEHVAKKQRQVAEALGKMRNQGQGLLPKSPMKGSKSPGRAM